MDHALCESHLERYVYHEGYSKLSPLLKPGTFISYKLLNEHTICRTSPTVTFGKSWMQRIKFQWRKRGQRQIFQTAVSRGTEIVPFPSVHPHLSMEEALTWISALSTTKEEVMFGDSPEHENLNLNDSGVLQIIIPKYKYWGFHKNICSFT